jgi:hypothetical protein
MTIFRNSPIPNRKFNPDMKGYGEMLCMGGMRRAMHTLAREVEALAKAGAPTSDDPDSDHYIASFSTSDGIQAGRLGPRAYGEVLNDSDHARAVEFGAHGVKRDRPMRNALDAVPAVHRSDH